MAVSFPHPVALRPLAQTNQPKKPDTEFGMRLHADAYDLEPCFFDSCTMLLSLYNNGYAVYTILRDSEALLCKIVALKACNGEQSDTKGMEVRTPDSLFLSRM